MYVNFLIKYKIRKYRNIQEECKVEENKQNNVMYIKVIRGPKIVAEIKGK